MKFAVYTQVSVAEFEFGHSIWIWSFDNWACMQYYNIIV